jgi:hypothetical protein
VNADRQLIETEIVAKEAKHQKELKHARSRAELHAIKQRNIQIALTATNVMIAGLTLLKVFGII